MKHIIKIGLFLLFLVLCFPFHAHAREARNLSRNPNVDLYLNYIENLTGLFQMKANLTIFCDGINPAAYYFNKGSKSHIFEYCPDLLNKYVNSSPYCKQNPEGQLAILAGHEFSHALLLNKTNIRGTIGSIHQSLSDDQKQRIEKARLRFVEKSNFDIDTNDYLDWMVNYDSHEQVDALGIKLAINLNNLDGRDIECFMNPIQDFVEKEVSKYRKIALQESLKEGLSDFSVYYKLSTLEFDFLPRYFKNNSTISNRINPKYRNLKKDQIYLMKVFSDFEHWYLPENKKSHSHLLN